jgi:hypothetical protein
MDSQHRHELEQNDLAEFIVHFREWWVQHGLKTLLMILVVVVALFAWQRYKVGQINRHNERWLEMSQASSPAAYHELAKLYDDAGYTALAHLRAGDVALRKVVGGDNPLAAYGIPSQEPVLTDEEKADLLDGAEQDYNAVIGMSGADQMIRLNAMLGLAAVYETKQQWDDARGLYDQILENAGDDYATIAATARARRAALERAAVPVRFAPPPPPPVESDASLSDLPLIPAAPLEGTAPGETPAATEPLEEQPGRTETGDGG